MTNAFYRERAKVDTRKKADLLAAEDGLKKENEKLKERLRQAEDLANDAEKRAARAEKSIHTLKDRVYRLVQRVAHLEGYLQRIADQDKPDTVKSEEPVDRTPTPLEDRSWAQADEPFSTLSRNSENRQEWYDL